MDTAYVILRDPVSRLKVRQYWLVIVDAFSEMRWSTVTTTKGSIEQEVKSVIRHCENMTGRRIKRLYTDGGREFINHSMQRFCDQNGSELHWSPARAHELNGIAERNVASFKDSVRTMVAHSGVKHYLWRYAARFQAYIWNRTRLGRHTGMTPMEAMTGRTPSVLHIGVFGCDVYVHQDKTQRDTTFAVKAEPGIYLGHDASQNCAIVMLLQTGKIVRTRDVEYREGSFTHARAHKEGTERRILKRGYEPLADDDQEEDASDLTVGQGQSIDNNDEKRDDVISDADEAQGGSDADSEPEETEEEFDVEEVIGHRGFGAALEYKVKWAGSDEQTWEPAANLTNAQGRIREYEQRGRRDERSYRPKTRSARSACSALKTGVHSEAEDGQLIQMAVQSTACRL